MSIEVRFEESGRDIVLRVPIPFAESLGIAPGGVADLDIQRGKLVVTLRQPADRLGELLAGVTPANTLEEIAISGPVGGELVD